MNYEHISVRRDQLETLQRYSDEIERRFDVVFCVKHGNSLLHLCGSVDSSVDSFSRPTQLTVFIRPKNPESRQNVSLAKAFVASLMTDAGGGDDEDETEDEMPWGPVPLDVSHMSHVHHKPLCAQHSSASNDDEEVHSFSPGAESNHDSCYDSDDSQSASHNRSDVHEDVSRTSSDTLAAEHTDQLDEHEGYIAKKEFAVKLGYTEVLLKSALTKLGPCATQNELLEELISLSSQDNHQTEESASEQMEETPVLEEPPPRKTSVSNLPTSSALEEDDAGGSNLRDIVIDGSNVAMSHGNKEVFSCHGIRLAVNWFKHRGHKRIIVFVPQWRKEAPRSDAPITDQEILLDLEREGILKFTPSRRVKGKRVVCYDDRYIINLALDTEGIVVSNDNYRDLLNESEEYKHVIEERLLMYTFVQDRFMPPDDPQGRYGPTLDNFLRKRPTVPEVQPPDCPYGRKCTFGNKCKYYHPERKNQPHRMVADKLAEQAKSLKASHEGDLDKRHASDGSPVKKPLSKTVSLQPTRASAGAVTKKALCRTRSLVPGLNVAPTSDEPRKPTHPRLAPQSNPHLTLTAPTPTDPDKWKSREDLVSAFQAKMAASESDGLKAKDSSAGLQRNWMMPHGALRATHSDPYQFFEGSGHLALAKKLSDEGRTSPRSPHKFNENSRESSVEGEPDEYRQKQSSSRQPSPPSASQGKNQHVKACRLLSLQGSEDPRWQRNRAKGNIHASSGSSPSGNQHMTVHRTASENTFTNKGATWKYNPEPAHLGPPPPSYVGSFGLMPQMILPNMNQPPPRAKMPLTRNESAPGAPSRRMPEHRPIGPPRMTRQNSSSDSQLHIQLGDAVHHLPLNVPSDHCPNAHWVGSFEQFHGHGQSTKRQAFHSYPRGDTSNHPSSCDAREQQCLNPGLVYLPQYSHHNIPDSVQPSRGPPDPRTLSPPHPSNAPPHAVAGPLSPPMPAMVGVGALQPRQMPQAPNISTEVKEKLFYHLCALFPAEKVERVMLDNPNVTDAKLLCALILQIPD